jgi:hypothetical protein
VIGVGAIKTTEYFFGNIHRDVAFLKRRLCERRKGDVMKFILSTLAAVALAGALLAQPAQAACVAGPYGWHCWHPHPHYWHPYHHGWHHDW